MRQNTARHIHCSECQRFAQKTRKGEIGYSQAINLIHDNLRSSWFTCILVVESIHQSFRSLPKISYPSEMVPECTG